MLVFLFLLHALALSNAISFDGRELIAEDDSLASNQSSIIDPKAIIEELDTASNSSSKAPRYYYRTSNQTSEIASNHLVQSSALIHSIFWLKLTRWNSSEVENLIL